MTHALDISLLSLSLFFLILLVPAAIFRYLGLGLNRNLVISFVRMGIQFSLVAVYLEYIFTLNSIALNLAWILVMLTAANVSILDRSGLAFRRFAVYTIPAHLLTLAGVLTAMLIVFDWEVLTRAQYLIPLAGMILGNILRTNVVALDRFHTELHRREDEYIQAVFLGASTREAVLPFVREACRAAVAPQLASVATMGLVALPGMMTGQILGGSSPVVAIKYQVLIMVGIFFSAAVSVFLAVVFSMRGAIDGWGRVEGKG
jgi:putative ABC transport system permease protein